MIVPEGSSATSVDWVLEGPNFGNRTAFTAAKMSDGRMFASMGYNITASALTNETWIWDPDTSIWEQVADSPNKTEASAAVGMPDGRVYIIGGASGGFLTNVTYYDSVSDSWGVGGALPGNLVWARAVAIDDDRIFIAGGATSFGVNDATDLCYIYDINTETFTPAASMPDQMMGGGMAIAGSCIFYVGGTDETVTLHSSVYVYDVDNNYWYSGNSLPEPLFCPSVAAGTDGNIYIMGGTTTFGVFSPGTTNAYIYRPYDGHVIELPDLDEPVMRAEAFETDDYRIVYFGGNDGSTPNTNVHSLKICDADASLSSSTVGQGESVWVRINISTNFLTKYGLGGTIYLQVGNLTYAAYFIDSSGEGDVMIEMPISENLPAGTYNVMLVGVNTGYYEQEFPFEPMALTVTDEPSTQEQLDELAQQNEDLQEQLNDTQGQLDDLEQQNSDLSDQLNDTEDQLDDLEAQNSDLSDQLNETQAELEDSISSKQDAMFGYIILVLVLVSLVIGVVILVRKK